MEVAEFPYFRALPPQYIVLIYLFRLDPVIAIFLNLYEMLSFILFLIIVIADAGLTTEGPTATAAITTINPTTGKPCCIKQLKHRKARIVQ